jgi:enoyl-CoA hydratase/carnithine racemase
MSTATEIAPFPLVIDESGPTAGVVVLRVEQAGSPVVVLDHPLIQRLEATLRQLPKTMTGFILASASSKVFIAGADLKTIQANPADPDSDRKLDAYLAYGQRVFAMIAELRCPTAAAISGAALGGGLELAMHCDALIGAPNPSGKPYPIGLPEAGLSICPGWGGTNLLPARMDPLDAIRRTATGKPMTYDEAVTAKLFDVVASSEAELLATAKAWVVSARAKMGQPGGIPKRDGAPSRWIGRPGTKATVLAALANIASEKLDTDSARAVLDEVRAGLDNGWQSALDLECRELTRLRNTPAGRAAIQAFFDKSKK